LALGAAQQVPPIDREGGGGGGIAFPSKGRSIERLEPQFAELKRVLDARNAVLASAPGAASPEQVLVLETIGPPADFLAAVRENPDLDWLVEHEEQVPPDDDFFKKKDEKDKTKLLSGCFYMVAFNLRALEQLLSIWNTYTKADRLPAGYGAWGKLFRCLRAVRRWGPEDRLREAGLLQQVFDNDLTRLIIPVEIELWSRNASRSTAAESHIRDLIEQAQGSVLDAASVPEIGYHALLAELPREYLGRLLDSRDVDLVLADEIYLLRPTAQCVPGLANDGTPFDGDESRQAAVGDPVCALLDGLPMENHPLLQGRIVVDDPDNWTPRYPVADRRHGTAMASLIVHGDLARGEPPIAAPIYVRPILRARGDHEHAPRNRLWLDLIHQAVRRMVASDGPQPPVAPTVRIINLSLGDSGRPFHFAPSPLARLLDWLSYKHELLFVVSAGNHDRVLPPSCQTDEGAIRHQFESARHNRLLSPAESVNALTVGALNADATDRSVSPHQRAIPHGDRLPAVYSALGRGIRRAVKPDVLAPGGRRVFRPQIQDPNSDWEPVPNAAVGHRVAAPSPAGNSQVARLSGTSNAAALTSRAAIQLLSVAERLRQTHPDLLEQVPAALLTKALLVHTASWPRGAFDFVRGAVDGLVEPNWARDTLAGLLGYGVIDADRGAQCRPERATAVAGGRLVAHAGAIHRFPIPPSIHLHRGWRRVTATLAWLSPIAPHDRRYRSARLRLDLPKEGRSPLLLESSQVHAEATVRGTVQHFVLEQDDQVINLLDEKALDFTVSCFEDAGEITEAVPYALAVSLEVAPGIALPIYTEVAARVAVPVQVRVS